MTDYTIIGPFTQVLPMTNLAVKGPLKDDELEIIPNGAILVNNDRIVDMGDFDSLRKSSALLNPKIEELNQAAVALPGFVDAHTHLCFAGSRAKDFAMRNAGKSYLDIAKSGGGIWDTVTKTRGESQEQLTAGILARAEQHIRNGVTTIEVKSGYGLSVQEELKMLRAIKSADLSCAADLLPTCLAAHIFPKDYNGDIQQYLEEIAVHLFPILKEEKLASRIDAFIEEEAYSSDVIRPYLDKARSMGFDICLHADQFSPGGTQVAVEHAAISADHLEASGDQEIELLAKSDVIPIALPGASIGLGCGFTPARKLLDAGTSLAIASDWNPGSAPMGDLLTQASILSTFEKLSSAEVFAALTCRAAAALGLTDRGQLKEACLADFIAFPTSDYREILYHQGQLKPTQVWKKGMLI